MRQLLCWYDARLPLDQELHLVGYSLGGVLLFQTLVTVLGEEPDRWQRRVRSLSTLSSPHFGCDLGLTAFLPGGPAARELCALGSDPDHRTRVMAAAARLRQRGIRLLTLAEEYDVVVTPEDAVIAPPDERGRFVLTTSRVALGGVYGDALHGHGLLLNNPRAWRLVAENIGLQEVSPEDAQGSVRAARQSQRE